MGTALYPAFRQEEIFLFRGSAVGKEDIHSILARSIERKTVPLFPDQGRSRLYGGKDGAPNGVTTPQVLKHLPRLQSGYRCGAAFAAACTEQTAGSFFGITGSTEAGQGELLCGFCISVGEAPED